jgi:hypothetical protein
MSSRTNSHVSSAYCIVFLQTVPGEGEVKLLEWIYSSDRRGESIAIFGGDSDLVLEGLMVPLKSTHNVFVMLPENNRQYLVVSLWETTRALARKLPGCDIVHLRTDLVILMILNGNDYLPKLRGSSGFQKLFSAYIHVQNEGRGNLVDPDSLEFCLPFCIRFFRKLATLIQPNIKQQLKDKSFALQNLVNFGEAGFIPKPIEFQVIGDSEEIEGELHNMVLGDGEGMDDDKEVDVDNRDFEEDQDDADDKVLVRLLLGEPGSGDFCFYETWHPRLKALKHAKHKLAAMAIKDLMDFDDIEGDSATGFTAKFGYDWEVLTTIEGKVDTYLYGILWNLQTYQDGICSDYAFNYGNRHSPSAIEIVKFFHKAQRRKENIGPNTLSSRPFSPPISAGVSCLAALPSTVKHLVPAPYRFISDERVENIYKSCVDPEDNSLDCIRFERLCEEEVTMLLRNQAATKGSKNAISDRRLTQLNNHSWDVVSQVGKPLDRPFTPPLPFSERVSELRSNNRIKISKLLAEQRPRPRVDLDYSAGKEREPTADTPNAKKCFRSQSTRHSEVAPFMTKLPEVAYKIAYKNFRQKLVPKQASHPSDVKKGIVDSFRDGLIVPSKDSRQLSNQRQENMATAQQEFVEQFTTQDGISAVACVKQLTDAGILQEVEWRQAYNMEEQWTENVSLRIVSKLLAEAAFYQSERSTFDVSRKLVKQSLASQALSELCSEWQNLSFKNLRLQLSRKLDVESEVKESNDAKVNNHRNGVITFYEDSREMSNVREDIAKTQRKFLELVTAKDDTSAVACIKQLADSGIIRKVKWGLFPHKLDPSAESLRLRVESGLLHQGAAIYEYERSISDAPRKAIKQYLASQALSEMCSQWQNLSFRDLRLQLSSRLVRESIK